MLLSGFVIIDKKRTQNTYTTHILQENHKTKDKTDVGGSFS